MRRHRTLAELSVSDDGAGIPESERERIFGAVARVDAARSRDRGGTGLGLAIARHIAHGHSGTLEAEEPAAGDARLILRPPIHDLGP